MSTLLTEVKRTRSAVQASKYRILGLVGRGQFGRVYCALHRQTGEFVALKALDLAAFPTAQFLRELRFLVTLQHPNIVMCQAIEHLHGKRYLVMDYCEGGTLRQLMENHERLHPTLSVKLVCDVLTGLEHAHQQEVVHCDIKPENILLSLSAEGWIARISDFGISRLSQEVPLQPANLTGSPAYMAPERFYGQYSHSTDLYAVGILLFELLAGYRPFSGLPAEMMAAHLNQPVKIPAHIPTALQSVIFRALEKLKARRFQSAAQMREALELAVQQRSEFQPKAQFASLIASKVHSPMILREERSLYPIEQIGIVETTSLPEYDRYVRRSSLIFLGQSQTLQVRSYPMGFFDRRDGKALPVATVAEPIRELIVRSQTCFAVTDRSIYKLSESAPQLLTRFHRSSRIAIDPDGNWMAVATLGSRNTAKLLSFWALPQPRLIRCPTVCEPMGELIALIAVHSRHVALISRHDRSTRFDLFNRRGQAFGTLNLPVQLKQVFQTAQSYCLVATEIKHERSLLLIHLKPYRLIRIAIAICPKLVAAFSWGVVVCHEDQLMAIDYEGQQIGRSKIPLHPSAIAAHGENGLAIATWHQGESKLYTLNLEAIRAANL